MAIAAVVWVVIDGGVEAPQFVSPALEVDVQHRVLEPNRVVVAPLSKLIGLGKVQGLNALQSESGDVLAFDIQTSGNALKEEPHFTSMAPGPERPLMNARRRVLSCHGGRADEAEKDVD